MNYYDTSTINEIRFQREGKSENNTNIISIRPNKYKVGQIVRFVIDTLIKVGGISNAMCRNGICTYHIEVPGGARYREIDQDAIKSIVKMG